MKRLAIALLLCACALPLLAGDKANLSGTWKFDRDRSFSNNPAFDQTMTITHAGDKVKLDAKQKGPQGETTITEEYLLDGTYTEFKPNGAPPEAKGKRKATWLPDGRGILVEDDIDTGKAQSHIARKLMLSANGQTLTVYLFIDDQRGSFEVKRVYNKVG